MLLPSQVFTSKPPNNPLPYASLTRAQIFHQYPPQIPQYFMDEVQASKDVIHDAIYYEKRVWVFFTLILPDNSLCKLTYEHTARRNWSNVIPLYYSKRIQILNKWPSSVKDSNSILWLKEQYFTSPFMSDRWYCNDIDLKWEAFLFSVDKDNHHKCHLRDTLLLRPQVERSSQKWLIRRNNSKNI